MYESRILQVHFNAFAILVLVVAFSIRLAVFSADFFVPRTSDDSERFKKTAEGLAAGNGFYQDFKVNGEHLRSYRPPLTPLVAAAILMLSGGKWWAVYVLLCFIGALTCVNIALIGRQLFGEAVGILSGVLAVFYPMFTILPSLLLSENLGLLIYSFTFLMLLKLLTDRSLKFAGVLGFILGLAVLNHASVAGFTILIGIYIYFSLRGSRLIRLASLTVMFLICFLTVSPWTIRNYRIHHTFVPVVTNAGITFWDGHNKYVSSGFQPSYCTADFPDNPFNWGAKSEVELDRMAYIEGFDFIARNPWADLRHNLRKLTAFWSPYNHALHKITYFPVLILGLIGIYLTRRRARDLMPFYILGFYLISLSVIFQGLPRYRMPFMIFLIMMAAVTLERGLLYAKSMYENRAVNEH